MENAPRLSQPPHQSRARQNIQRSIRNDQRISLMTPLTKLLTCRSTGRLVSGAATAAAGREVESWAAVSAVAGERPATRQLTRKATAPMARHARLRGMGSTMRAVATRSQFECRIGPLVGVIRYPIDGKPPPRLTNDWKKPVAYRLLIWLG